MLTLKVFSEGEHHRAPFDPRRQRGKTVLNIRFSLIITETHLLVKPRFSHNQRPDRILEILPTPPNTNIPRLLKIVEDKGLRNRARLPPGEIEKV